MKREVAGLRNETSELRAVNRRIFAILARIEGRFDDMATKDDVNALRSQMDYRFDGFAKLYDGLRFRWAAQADTLGSHDKRISRLESRRA